MHRSDCKEKRNRREFRKICGETQYNAMVRKGPREVAKEVFYRPPYYGCNWRSKGE